MTRTEWQLRPLGSEVEQLDAGVSVNADDRPHGVGEIGVLKTSALTGGNFNESENKAVLHRDRTRVRVSPAADSILVSRMNTPALVGESAYVDRSHPDLFLPDRIWQLRFRNRKECCVRWVAHYLQSHSAKAYISLNATGTSGSMKNLPKSRLLAMPIRWPLVSEQRRIAEILDTLDEAIRKTEQLIAKLKQVKQGLLHDLLTCGIDENGELRDPERHPEQFKKSLLGRIPKAWEIVPFGELCESSAFGPRFPADRYSVNGPLATLRTTDMDEEGNIDLGTMPRAAISPTTFTQHLLLPNDLLISRSGTCGIAAVFPGHTIDVVPGAFLIRFRLRQPRLSRVYRRYFNSFVGRPALERLAVGGVQKNIKGSEVLALPVPQLSEWESDRVVQVIEEKEASISTAVLALHKLRLLKQGLMEDLLTGRVPVTPLLNEASP